MTMQWRCWQGSGWQAPTRERNRRPHAATSPPKSPPHSLRSRPLVEVVLQDDEPKQRGEECREIADDRGPLVVDFQADVQELDAGVENAGLVAELKKLRLVGAERRLEPEEKANRH